MHSTRTGMGATPHDGGTTFRVWAPSVDSVSVAGNFNNWSDSAAPLFHEANGYWSVDVPGVKVGAEYKYVIKTNSAPEPLWKQDPYARDLTSSNGNSVVFDLSFNWKPISFQMPTWNELVIYELHVGTFNDKPGDERGTFDSVREKLDILQSLGINAIEILPSAEFPGDLSWGYNLSCPFAIESAFGNLTDLKEFVQDAHEHGIAVILDVVYNHLGPNDLDLWQFTGWNQNGKGGVYFYNDWRCWTPWGETRLDYGRGETRQYIRDNALMWLEECQIDGLRFDATAYITNAYGKNNDSGSDIPDGWNLLQWINDEIGSKQSWKITIAEDLRNNEWLTKDTGAGGAGFDAQWADRFFHPICEAITAPADGFRNMYAVRDAIYHRYGTDAFERVIYTESHDEVAKSKNTQERPDKYRIPEQIWRGHADSWFSRKRSTLGAVLVFTSPGIPMIFQGQEFLEWGSWSDDTPLDWGKKDQFAGIWDMYQTLIRLRRNWFNNTRGLRGQHVNVYHVNNNDKVVALHRWEHGGPGDDVVVVINMADRSYDSYNIGFPRDGTWYVRFNSDWKGFSSDFGNHAGYDTTAGRALWGNTDGMPYGGNVGIGAYSALILSQ